MEDSTPDPLVSPHPKPAQGGPCLGAGRRLPWEAGSLHSGTASFRPASDAAADSSDIEQLNVCADSSDIEQRNVSADSSDIEQVNVCVPTLRLSSS